MDFLFIVALPEIKTKSCKITLPEHSFLKIHLYTGFEDVLHFTWLIAVEKQIQINSPFRGSFSAKVCHSIINQI